MQFIKADIDGTGNKWRLAVIRKQGTTYYFPEEDFEDFVENYNDCEKKPVLRPGIISVAVDELAEAIECIVDGELWAGRVQCCTCSHEWVACFPWKTTTFECPKCGRMDGKKKFNCSEEAAVRIATALVNVLGVPAKNATAVMENFITQVIPEGDVRRGWWFNAMKYLVIRKNLKWQKEK